MRRRFRSKILSEVYEEAAQQGFEPGFQQGSGHYSLRCPARGCGRVLTLSGTVSDSHRQKIQNCLSELRRHGFVWQGRGGEHTAPRLHKTLRREREAS